MVGPYCELDDLEVRDKQKHRPGDWLEFLVGRVEKSLRKDEGVRQVAYGREKPYVIYWSIMKNVFL